MSLKFSCPNPECGRKLKVKDELAGKKVKCPDCGGIVPIEDGDVKPDPLIGTQIAHYKILALAGEGGMASVYKARNVRLNRIVALKMLPQSLVERKPSMADRIIREARSAAQLEHPNVVTVYFVGAEGGHYFVEMQFVDGPTAREIVRAQGDMDIAEATRIILDAARALAAAHEKGIIHRDVKPDNIMLSEDGTVRVADFGLAKLLDKEGEEFSPGQVLGTPLYMSPEQCQGKPTDARSDIYSLGATYFYMLTGSAPFTGEEPRAIARKHVTEAPPPASSLRQDIPKEVDAIIDKMMAKNPDERYQNCQELIDDLQKAASEMSAPVAVTEIADDEAVEVVPQSTGLWLVAAAVVFIVGIVAVATWIVVWREPIREKKKQRDAPPVAEQPRRVETHPAEEQPTAVVTDVQPAKPEKPSPRPPPAAKPEPATPSAGLELQIPPVTPPEKAGPERPAEPGAVAGAEAKPETNYASYRKAMEMVNALIDSCQFADALQALQSVADWPEQAELKRRDIARLRQRWTAIIEMINTGETKIPVGQVSRRYAFAGNLVAADETEFAAELPTDKKVRTRYKWKQLDKEEMIRLWAEYTPDDDAQACVDLAIFCMEGGHKCLEEAERYLSKAAAGGVDVSEYEGILEFMRKVENAPQTF